MTTETISKTSIPKKLDGSVLSRLLEEGYGPGAWHGSDMRAAIADVKAADAFWKPAEANHSIAEIVLHHAWTVRNVNAQLSGSESPAFPVAGDDWLKLAEDKPLSWRDIQRALETQQRALAATVADIAAGRLKSPVAKSERFDLALGVTCHAVYHAGQIQLIKVMRG